MPDAPNPTHPPLTCLWCDFTMPVKSLIAHAEQTHPRQWRDLGLYQPIAGTRI